MILEILAAEGPATEEGEVVDRLRAVLLDGHRKAEHDPAGGLIRRNADGFVGRDARQSAHVLDIRLGVVLAGRRPLADNLTNGKQPVLVVVRACEQIKGCAPSILKRFKLAKTGKNLRPAAGLSSPSTDPCFCGYSADYYF